MSEINVEIKINGIDVYKFLNEAKRLRKEYKQAEAEKLLKNIISLIKSKLDPFNEELNDIYDDMAYEDLLREKYEAIYG